MIDTHCTPKAASSFVGYIRTTIFILCLAIGLSAAPHAGANVKESNAKSQSPNPATAPSSLVDSMPHIGLDSGDVMDLPALNNAHASGVRVARLSVLWSAIEPSD